jgi:hypothetical protein
MTARRILTLLLISGGLTFPASPALAQPANLTESPRPGDCSRYTLELGLTGHLIVVQDGRKEEIRLEARGRHVFAERTLAVADGIGAKSARHYEDAAATAAIAGDRVDRSLPADRRLIVAHRHTEGMLCYAPAGPLARDELDLVTEHLNPQCLAGLLPGRDVNVGDTWPVGNAAAQAACLFDGLVKNGLVGKLTEVKDGRATFAIDGPAEGIEDGARVALSVSAVGKYDLASKRVVELTWKQRDDREQGAASPASRVEATVTLRREVLPQPPKELTDAALAAVPTGDPPAAMTHLRHADPKGRYRLVYPREWHITGQTDTHLVLRLLDRGEFVAQATVGVWKKAEPGRHDTPDEFKKAVAQSPEWTAGKTLEDGELPADRGRWHYRLTAEGRIGDAAVVQSFHLLAGPQGDQVAVTFSMRPEKLKAVGTRDAALVGAIEFGAAK